MEAKFQINSFHLKLSLTKELLIVNTKSNRRKKEIIIIILTYEWLQSHWLFGEDQMHRHRNYCNSTSLIETVEDALEFLPISVDEEDEAAVQKNTHFRFFQIMPLPI